MGEQLYLESLKSDPGGSIFHYELADFECIIKQ